MGLACLCVGLSVDRGGAAFHFVTQPSSRSAFWYKVNCDGTFSLFPLFSSISSEALTRDQPQYLVPIA